MISNISKKLVAILKDGGWTDWSEWGSCSLTCGGGNQTHTRTCSNPAPNHGGQECHGNDSELQSCNENSCPIGKSIFKFKLLKSYC